MQASTYWSINQIEHELFSIEVIEHCCSLSLDSNPSLPLHRKVIKHLLVRGILVNHTCIQL